MLIFALAACAEDSAIQDSAIHEKNIPKQTQQRADVPLANSTKTETVHYDDGGWAEIQTLGGDYHGSWTVYRPDGSKSWQRYHRHSEQHGPDRKWYEDGQLEYERHYENDDLHGDWLAWHTNGQLKHESQFVKGDQRGQSRWYDINGELLAELHIDPSGDRHGTQIASFLNEESPSGLRLGIATYVKGKYQGYEYFDELPEGYSEK